MAVGTNLFSTYDIGSFGYGAGGSATAINHEDFIDVQVILGATQTPAFSSFRKDRMRDVVQSWSVDTLAATSTAGTQEGQTFSAEALVNAVRLMNVSQLFSKGVRVSDREREINPAGGFRDILDKEVMKAFKENARNTEARIFATGAVGSATGDEATTSGRMASLSGLGIRASGASASGVFLNDIYRLSQDLFEQGIEPDSIWFAPAHKRDFFHAVTGSTTSVNVRNIAAIDNRFQANVEVMESPFGQLFAIITDRFIPTSNVSATTRAGYYIADRSLAALPFLRPPQMKEMGKAGDYTDVLILHECSLRLDHPTGWGTVSGLTAA